MELPTLALVIHSIQVFFILLDTIILFIFIILCFFLTQVKTKMQAQAGFENEKMINTFVRVFKAEGVKGLYRGLLDFYLHLL